MQVHDRGFDELVYTNSVADASARFYAVSQRAINDRQMRTTFRQHLEDANEDHPTNRIAPEFYDISDTLALPAVPETLANPTREIAAMVGSELSSAAGTLASGALSASMAAYRNSPSALEVIQEAFRVSNLYGVPAGRRVLQGAGISAEVLGYLMRGTGHALSGTISAANHVLAVTDRRSEYHRANGVSVVGHLAGLRGNLF